MNEYEHVLAEKAAEYISSGDFDSAEEIFKNYSGKSIDKIYYNYTLLLFEKRNFHKFYDNSYIHYHTVDQAEESCPTYREYCNYLKKFDENDKDKRLLICGVMPFGDQIFFTRFLSVILDITKNITVITLPRLVDHFTNTFPDIKFVDYDFRIEVEKFDCVLFMPYISMFAFNKNNLPKKTLEPTVVTNTDKVNKLRLRPDVKGKIIIGFSWKSARNDIHSCNDKGSAKSLMVKQLLPFFNIPNTVFVNLQHGDFNQELFSFLENYKVDNIVTFEDLDMHSTTEHIFNYVDMCDYIIGPTNTLSIMAGALHKKTFTLVPNKKSTGRLYLYHEIPEDRRHAFFPTMKMYEQDDLFSWDKAIGLAKNDLISEINER